MISRKELAKDFMVFLDSYGLKNVYLSHLMFKDKESFFKNYTEIQWLTFAFNWRTSVFPLKNKDPNISENANNERGWKALDMAWRQRIKELKKKDESYL